MCLQAFASVAAIVLAGSRSCNNGCASRGTTRAVSRCANQNDDCPSASRTIFESTDVYSGSCGC